MEPAFMRTRMCGAVWWRHMHSKRALQTSGYAFPRLQQQQLRM
jgi:hypothetical protein